jgi:replicative DNA helicase
MKPQITQVFTMDTFIRFDRALAEGDHNFHLKALIQLGLSAFSRDPVETGFDDLTRALSGGFRTGELIVLGGRPNNGKTALATNIAYNVANSAGAVAYISLELTAAQVARRVVSEQAEISARALSDGTLNRTELRRLREITQAANRLPLHIDHVTQLSVTELSDRVRRLASDHQLRLIVVDYLQLVGGATADVTAGLKALALDLNVPVIALSQLSPQIDGRDDKCPQLSDLPDCSIEQLADAVLLMYREAADTAQSSPAEDSADVTDWQHTLQVCMGQCQVHIAKQSRGPVGKVQLAFNPRCTRFGNC